MVKVREIVRQNPWWNQGMGFASYDPHLIKTHPIFFQRKEIDLVRGNIYVLRGCRQVGKSTYLKTIIKQLIEGGVNPKHILYLSLDFFTSRRELRNTINYFLNETQEAEIIYMLLDEITFLKDWNLEFKYLADQGITGKSIIIATGSSAVKLKEKGELLPGRGLEGNEYYIKPLSFREFSLQSIKFIRGILPNNELRDSLERLEENLNRTSIDLSLDLQDIQQEIANLLPFKNEVGYLLRKYLITGGLPRVINHYFENWREEFKEYINPVIAEIYIRDILGDIAKIDRQEIIARKLLKAILNKYGSRFSFNALARQTGRSHVTTIDYFDHFQESFICFILYAYDFNKNFSKLKGDKKIYFFDPFILHAAKSYLQGEEVQTAITRTLQDEEIQSQVLEGIVVSHLLLHREIPYVRSGQTFLWNYYNKSGKEMDAIIKLNGGYLGVEVKYQSHVDRRDIQRIKEVKDYIILSKEDTDNTDNLIISPLDIFLALITQSEKNL